MKEFISNRSMFDKIKGLEGVLNNINHKRSQIVQQIREVRIKFYKQQGFKEGVDVIAQSKGSKRARIKGFEACSQDPKVIVQTYDKNGDLSRHIHLVPASTIYLAEKQFKKPKDIWNR